MLIDIKRCAIKINLLVHVPSSKAFDDVLLIYAITNRLHFTIIWRVSSSIFIDWLDLCIAVIITRSIVPSIWIFTSLWITLFSTTFYILILAFALVATLPYPFSSFLLITSRYAVITVLLFLSTKAAFPCTFLTYAIFSLKHELINCR